jgi:hypothetical protein
MKAIVFQTTDSSEPCRQQLAWPGMTLRPLSADEQDGLSPIPQYPGSHSRLLRYNQPPDGSRDITSSTTTANVKFHLSMEDHRAVEVHLTRRLVEAAARAGPALVN